MFTEVVCLGTGADKDEALAKYKDSGLWWVEDKVANAEAGAKAGLKPIVMEHGFNMNDKHDYHVATNWQDIYNLVTKSYSNFNTHLTLLSVTGVKYICNIRLLVRHTSSLIS